MTLTVTTTREGPVTTLKLAGDIDESFQYEGILSALDTPNVVFELSDIHRINSSGIREWLHFVAELRERSVEIVLRACAPAVVAQLNMIANFAASARVESVLAPYVCQDCDAEQCALVELERGATIAATRPCGECGGAAAFDDIPEQFLDFVRRHPTGRPPATP